MESKSFVTLSNPYKMFLKDIETKINEFNINENSKLPQLELFYEETYKLLDKHELQISDINHMITNYNKDNNIINNLKKIISLRNYVIIKMAMNSSKWKDFIKEIKEKYKKSTKESINGVLKLFEIYIGTWNTINRFIKIKNNRISLIEIIDPEDYDLLEEKI